jgi:hypothetical protein
MTDQEKLNLAIALAKAKNATAAQPAAPRAERLGVIDAAKDVGGAALAGLGRGAAQLVGLPGTIGDLMDAGAKRMGLLTPNAPGSPLSGGSIQGAMGSLTGGASEYRGKSTPAQYAGTVGEFLPGAAAFGGVNPGNILRYGVAPGLASEAAGQATEGTSLEPWARAGAAIATPIGINAAERGIRAAISPFGGADPERLNLAKVLDDYGIPVTAGQRVGSEGLRRIEGATAKGAAIGDAQVERFTEEVLKTAGITAKRATGDVIGKAFDDIGKVFDDVTRGIDVVPDQAELVAFSKAMATYRDLTPSAQVSPIFNNINARLVESYRSGTPIPAKDVTTWRSTLSKLTTSADAGTRSAAQEAVSVLDDTLAHGMTYFGRPDDVVKLATARAQYRNLLAIERAAATAGETARAGLLSPASVARAVSNQGRRAFITGKRGDLGDVAIAAEGVIRPLPTVSEGGMRGIRGMAEAMSVGGGAALGGPLGAMAGLAAPSLARNAVMLPVMQRLLANQAVGPMPQRAGSVLSTIPGLLAQ